MKNLKNITLFLTLTYILSTNNAFCTEKANNENTKSSSKQLKATVRDNREEYINNDWWDRFHDPILKGYIQKAINANHDLKIASLRVLETQALVRESLGREFPVIMLDSDFSRRKTSGNTSMGSMKYPSYTQNAYSFPLNVNYELDLWRKNREKTIMAAKELEAAKHEEKASCISLTAVVASVYFNIISLDRQIELQKEIINLKKAIYELTKENNNYGIATATDVVLASKSLLEAQSALNDLEKRQNILLNQLAVLTGVTSEGSLKLERASFDEVELMKDIPNQIQADIIKQRPDILKAEAEIQKTKIDVNLARKELLPDITIMGQFGFNANSLSKTFKWDSYIASVGVNLAQIIFAGGQKKAKLKAKKYRYEQTLENYQKTILTSIQEVNDSLVSLKFDLDKNSKNIERLKAEGENLDSIMNKYQQGLVSYLDTLHYRENVIFIEKEQVQSKTDCLTDLLSLYKAVGGKL